MGTVVPHAFIQGSGQVPGPAAHARGLLSALQCGDSPGPELPGVIIYSFSNKSCPSLCRLCTPVLWAPSFIREAPRYGEVSASDGQRALRTCPADKCNHRTDPLALQACSLPPRSPQASGAQSRPPPPPPALVGGVWPLLHAIMTFWVIYTFSPSHGLSPSFFMRTGTRLMTEPLKKRHAMPP